MTSIINRIGLIAVLVTSTLAFDLSAEDATMPAQTSNSQLAKVTQTQADALLDGLHLAASKADWQSYFNAYHVDGVFLGTDAKERWNMEEFKRYASASQGWHYEVKRRRLRKINDLIIFDEILHSPAYGISRGTGALVHTQQGWKVAQYHLSFPIPNEKAKQITQLIVK